MVPPILTRVVPFPFRLPLRVHTQSSTESRTFSRPVVHLVLQNWPNLGAPARSFGLNGLVKNGSQKGWVRLSATLNSVGKLTTARHIAEGPRGRESKNFSKFTSTRMTGVHAR
jgi:hypothetical protein